MSNQLPPQPIWGFDGISPGPTYVAQYNTPILVRNVNNLPANNGGFGKNSVSTHLHNSHTPSESDGFPCDFFEATHFYDQYYPNKYAGFNSTHRPNGDINEAMSTLWYHDHRVDFTSQSTRGSPASTCSSTSSTPAMRRRASTCRPSRPTTSR